MMTTHLPRTEIKLDVLPKFAPTSPDLVAMFAGYPAFNSRRFPAQVCPPRPRQGSWPYETVPARATQTGTIFVQPPAPGSPPKAMMMYDCTAGYLHGLVLNVGSEGGPLTAVNWELAHPPRGPEHLYQLFDFAQAQGAVSPAMAARFAESTSRNVPLQRVIEAFELAKQPTAVASFTSKAD